MRRGLTFYTRPAIFLQRCSTFYIDFPQRICYIIRMYVIRFMQDNFYALITDNSSSAFDPIRTFVSNVLQGKIEPVAYMMQEDNTVEIARTFTPLYNTLCNEHSGIQTTEFGIRFSSLHFVTQSLATISVSGGHKLQEVAKHDFFSTNSPENLCIETDYFIAIGWAKYETKDCFVITPDLYHWKSNEKMNVQMHEKRLLAIPKSMSRPITNNEYFAKKLKYGF